MLRHSFLPFGVTMGKNCSTFLNPRMLNSTTIKKWTVSGKVDAGERKTKYYFPTSSEIILTKKVYCDSFAIFNFDTWLSCKNTILINKGKN